MPLRLPYIEGLYVINAEFEVCGSIEPPAWSPSGSSAVANWITDDVGVE